MISALSFFRFGRRLGRLGSRKVKGRPEIFIIIRVCLVWGEKGFLGNVFDCFFVGCFEIVIMMDRFFLSKCGFISYMNYTKCGIYLEYKLNLKNNYVDVANYRNNQLIS